MMTYNPLYGNFRTRTFCDIFPDVETFIAETPETLAAITDTSLTTLYYLLYARYGNSHIASDDENQFKYQVYSTIFMYGPTWEARLAAQKELRNLDIEELQSGNKNILNTALNPGGVPTTADLTELNYINQQNTSNHRKGKLEAYAALMDVLKTDVTEDFIGKFKKLFLWILEPYSPLYYATKIENSEV